MGLIKFMNKRATYNFHLPIGICHLVFICFFVISETYLYAQKAEVQFLEGILEQVTPGKKFIKESKTPLDSFELFKKVNPTQQIWVSYWQYKDYRYPIFVQEVSGEIEDIYLAFPSFFLHDRIHEQLLSKWGKQQFYQHSNLSAIYSWKNINSNQLAAVYEANCSITCFPVSLALQKNTLKAAVSPLWQQFHQQSLSKTKKKK
jgi:hypothetical protein